MSIAEVWNVILARRREEGTAFVISTSKAECADRCDIVTLLHEGRIMAVGTPEELKSRATSDTIVVDAVRNPLIKSKIKKRFTVAVQESKDVIKLQSADTMETVLALLEEYGSEIGAVYIRQPDLDDVLDGLIADELKHG